MKGDGLQRGYLSGGGLIFLVVASVGLFSGYLYWLKQSGSEVEQAAKQALKPVKKRAAEQPKEEQFHFDFFSMLPQEEYSGIEEKPVEKRAAKPKSTPKKEPERAQKQIAKRVSPTGNYVIQMGAFGSRKSADQHKAELILMGVEQVTIDTAKSAKGVLYKVNVGPFQSFSSAEHQQAMLKQAGYSSFLKKTGSNGR